MIFGQLPIEPEVLATTLVFELTDEVRRQGKEANWTHILKAILRRMGQERGYKVNPDPDWEPPTIFTRSYLVEERKRYPTTRYRPRPPSKGCCPDRVGTPSHVVARQSTIEHRD